MMLTGTILALKGDNKINTSINKAITAGCCCYPDTPSCVTRLTTLKARLMHDTTEYTL